MPPLADTQSAIATAMLRGDASLAPPALVGGGNAAARFAIHVRHYETSLRTSLGEKFPATVWLVGTQRFAAVASAYVRAHPPRTPCIAEYGREFPSFVACFERLRDLPYLEAFVELDWLLGRTSIAVDSAPSAWDEIAQFGSDRLLDAHVGLQPGLSYLRVEYPVDALMRLYLSDREPDTFPMAPCDTPLELYGARGSLRMTRLDTGVFAFRAALRAGRTIGDAASRALDSDVRFDAGRALRDLVASGLVTSTRFEPEKQQC